MLRRLINCRIFIIIIIIIIIALFVNCNATGIFTLWPYNDQSLPKHQQSNL